MGEAKNPFSLLVRPVRRLVERRGFITPTDPQAEAIPPILDGKNVLLIAPTGTGKTEAAMLPIWSMYLERSERPPGIKILYITPLRALNRDLMERLTWWCKELDIKLAVRHGDTETRERTTQALSPPDLLITTPETLQAILTGRKMRRHLQSVSWVVIDEVHELAEDKRGSQLSLALERLRWMAGRDFQIIGLSATIGSPEKVGRFLVGEGRSVEIVKVPVARYMTLKVLHPKPEPQDDALAAKLYTHAEVASRLKVMRELIEGHQSSLLFTNTRSIAEVLASRFKVWDVDFPISIHHGSLAKPARITAERGLKEGNLRGVVCTSSLELGIDVGRIELCIQYMSPRQVTRLVQRVGRSGHQVGRVAKGIIVTMDSDDTLEAMVVARRALKEDLEPVSIPEKPLDALTHQIVGVLIQEGRIEFEQLLNIFRKAYPYRDLTEEELVKVINYMHTRYPRLAWASFDDKVVTKPFGRKDMYEYYFENLSMIPDEKQYLVVDEEKDAPVGVLDEAFVAEYGDPGTKFIVRGSPWRISSIYGDRIYVRSIKDPTGAIPSWIGEEIPVPFDVALEVGEIRRFVEERLASGDSQERIASDLSSRYQADGDTISSAIAETVQQVEEGHPAPTDRRVLVEDWEDFIIVSCVFGSLTNRTLGLLIGQILSEETGHTVGIQQDPYRIVIQAAKGVSSSDVLRTLMELARADVGNAAVRAAVKTGLFKHRLVHVAKKFGALSKWVDLGNIGLQHLQKSFEGTVIYDEAVKETTQKDMDLEHAAEALQRIREGEIQLVEVRTEGEATPVARIGIERIGRKTDLMPPEKLKYILLESAKARLMNEVRTFVCTNCWGFTQMIRVRDLPEKLTCPKCGSDKIGLSSRSEEELQNIVEKRGESLLQSEKKLVEHLRATADSMARYGRSAAIVLSGRRIRVSDAMEILAEEGEVSDKLFSLIIEAERNALKRRFW